MAARGGNNHYHREDDDVAANVLHFIAQHVLVPPLYIVLLGSVSACLLNALCNYVAHEPRVLVHSFAAWRRVLRLSTETHVVTPPPAPPPTRVTTPQRRTPATATVSVQQQLHKRNGNGNSNRHNNKQHRDVYERASGHSVASWRTRTASAYVDDDTAASTPTRAPRRASYNVEDEDSVFDRAACMNNNNNDNDGNSCRHVGTMYDSAAFFRVMDGMAAHSPTTAQLASMAATTTASAAAAAAAASSTAGAARTTAMATDECPPAVVPAPVVAEALTRSLADVRRAHQRRVFAYHPNFMIAAAVKSFVMLIVIQYYFDSIPGGWHRLCVCGTANVMSGLLMPVLEYTANLLLPLDATPSQASVAAGVVVGAAAAAVATASGNGGGGSGGSGSNGNGKGDGSGGAVGDGEDASKDRALFAELLLSIARLELSSLSTVLVQGSLFVCFAAILLPVLVVLCIPGAVLYVWLLLPPWVVYAALRHVYYRGATRQPTATSHSSVALLWFVWELLKMTAMKVLTLWLLQVSLQTTLLLGLSFIEQRTYTDALRDAVAPQVVRRYPHGPVNAFRLLCVVSQLVL